MRIQLDDHHFLNTDSFCCWITREKPNKDGKVNPRNMSGYYPTFTGAVESYIERRIKSSEATENSGKVYSTEIWDTGEVRIVTEQGYINQLSEHTVVVTDRSLDDVPQEIWDSMDAVESEVTK